MGHKSSSLPSVLTSHPDWSNTRDIELLLATWLEFYILLLSNSSLIINWPSSPSQPSISMFLHSDTRSTTINITNALSCIFTAIFLLFEFHCCAASMTTRLVPLPLEPIQLDRLKNRHLSLAFAPGSRLEKLYVYFAFINANPLEPRHFERPLLENKLDEAVSSHTRGSAHIWPFWWGSWVYSQLIIRNGFRIEELACIYRRGLLHTVEKKNSRKAIYITKSTHDFTTVFS